MCRICHRLRMTMCRLALGPGRPLARRLRPLSCCLAAVMALLSRRAQTLASDWANLTFAISDELIVDLDVNSGSTSAQYQGITNGEGWFAPGGSQYNTASGASFFDNGAIVFGISLIETKS